MNINCNQNISQNMAFKGKLKLIGATKELRQVFFNNETLKKLANSSPYDIVGSLKSRSADRHEIYREGRDEVLFKFSLTAKRPIISFIDKILNFINPKPVLKPTRNYHSEASTIKIIKGYNDLEAIKKELKI